MTPGAIEISRVFPGMEVLEYKVRRETRGWRFKVVALIRREQFEAKMSVDDIDGDPGIHGYIDTAAIWAELEAQLMEKAKQ